MEPVNQKIFILNKINYSTKKKVFLYLFFFSQFDI